MQLTTWFAARLHTSVSGQERVASILPQKPIELLHSLCTLSWSCCAARPITSFEYSSGSCTFTPERACDQARNVEHTTPLFQAVSPKFVRSMSRNWYSE